MNGGSPPPLTLERLCTAFRDLGLSCGDSVLVHSACSSFGLVEGRAVTILNAPLGFKPLYPVATLPWGRPADPGGTPLERFNDRAGNLAML
jgi:hypothetical protein